MLVFRQATDVTITANFVDADGNAVTPSAVSYRVLDETRSVLATGSATFNPGDTSTDITVLAANNALAVGVVRGMRVVELIMTTASGTKIGSTYYVVEADDTLIGMKNTYQTLEQAELVALDLPELVVWETKTITEKRAALVDAFNRLGTLTYSIGWVEDQSKINWGNRVIRSLNTYTPAEFAELPEKFRKALMRAQVVEAEIILGGDNIGDQRREGLMSHTVGESSQMYRPGKPVMLPVSNQALKQLAGFVTFNPILGRL